MYPCLFSLTRATALRAAARRGPPPPKKKAALQQKKAVPSQGDVPAHLRRYRPHLPESLVLETVSFLRSSSKLRALLDLIFSPTDSRDTEADRLQFQSQLEEYHLRRQRHDLAFLQRESAAAASAWRALASLPSDLYDEAIKSSNSSAVSAAPDEAAAAGAAGGAAEPNAAQQFLLKTQGRTTDTPAATAVDAAAEMETEDWGEYRQQKFPEELAFHRVYRQQLFESLTAAERHKLQVYQNLMHIRFPHSELKERQPELFWISERQAMGRQKENALKNKKKQK